MDDLVGVHDLLDEVAGLLVVHRPDLLDSLLISFLKLFEALLELDELVGEELVLFGVIGVLVFGLSLLHLEELDLVTVTSLVLVELELESLLLLVKDLLSLEEDIVVEAKLLLVKLVDGLHVFHALLKDLHLSLKLNLLLGLLVGILAHDVLELLSVLFLLLLSLEQEAILDRLVLLEEVLDLFLVALADGLALIFELTLDLDQMGVVSGTHVHELLLHSCDQGINIRGHALDGLDVVLVLGVDLTHELLDQVLLVIDDLSASSFLSLNVLF